MESFVTYYDYIQYTLNCFVPRKDEDDDGRKRRTKTNDVSGLLRRLAKTTDNENESRFWIASCARKDDV